MPPLLKKRTKLLIFTMLAFGCIQGICQVNSRASFDKKLYSVAAMRGLGTSASQFSTLTARQKQDLLATREVLVGFFLALDTHGRTAEFLTEGAQKTISNDLLGPETALMQVGVVDWNIHSPTEIELRFFTTVHSEGSWNLGTHLAMLKKGATTWRIAAIAWNDEPDRK